MIFDSLTAGRAAGALRVGLSVLALLLLGSGVFSGGVAAYLAAGFGLTFGALLALGRPQVLARGPLMHVAVDAALVGVLVASTGGAPSAASSYFFLVAAGVAWVETPARAALASSFVLGGYALASVAAGGSLGSARVLLGLGVLALLCAVANSARARVDDLRRRGEELAAEGNFEKERAEGAEAVISGLGEVFEVLDIERMLQWTAEASHKLAEGSYAHVAALYGNYHRSVAAEDLDYCPTWWHPSIQRLVLWCCREGVAVRSDESVRGIDGFLSVPLGSPAREEKWGAIVVGGKVFGAEEERALESLAAAVAPALERSAEEAPGGRDQISGLPNGESLRRVLRRELAQGRTLTLLAVGLGGLGDYYRSGDARGDELLRRLGARLESIQQRAFRHGFAELVFLLSGNGEGRTRRALGAIRQMVSQETSGSSEQASLSVSAGLAVAEPRKDAEPDAVVGAALRALEEAGKRSEGIAGAAPEPDGDEVRISGIVKSLVEALEAKDPYAGDHLRAVARLSSQLARELSLDEEQRRILVTGALLHDVGKIGIPDHILLKPARLTEEEYETIKRHPVLGAEILAPVEELAPAVAAVRHHHERFDGRGYPDGLRAEDIPLGARIISVADAFDSITRDRPYGYGVARDDALEEIRKNSGTQFDPRAVSALLGVAERLGDRRLGSTG